ncbi:MAG TPA: maltose alpha-D-glucosyltransferase [Candidatus Acidoferrales bacterium]|nr:maltose alpha-D-glucosyltransferase [Candidatus Acidoferrales bacterium]
MIATVPRRHQAPTSVLEDDPLWYQDAVVYELHVRAFQDSDGDGIGDFRGLLERLPYLQELGVTALWLLPFYPSPLRDDGYDIADYVDVNPTYGRLGDVRQLIREAHRRGLRVITELVCNHTSDQHPWFQRARRAAPGTTWRKFYVWSETNQRYQDARIIFKDFEVSNWTWDQVANAYYWHRFYSHQPDLNFDHPKVKEAIFRACDFWLEMGVDGMRLDAIPYLFEREGTNCENLPQTHEFLRELRRHIDADFPNRMLLAEANQWPEDAAAYFGQGDECHMSFHFPLMPRLFMAIRMEDRFPVVDILAQTPPIPETAQWALFLRNHDELTLEMVTDEERDYMYRSYTQDREARLNLGIRRRLAPLLGNHRRRIELMNGLLFSLPGTPVLYYGDEIGMGDNIFLGDRNGVRTPMQWSGDRNAGFSKANRQRLYLPVITDPEYHYETVNVETQQQNPHSLLGWMRRLIALRKRHRAFGRGTLEFLRPDNRKVLAFVRRFGSEQILCVANLSRFVQGVELDLSAWQGLVPVEMWGRTEFPAVGERPYFLTLGPHEFYWFSMQPAAPAAISAPAEKLPAELPQIVVQGAWTGVLEDTSRERLQEVLAGYMAQRRWFAGKARRLKSIELTETIPVPGVLGGACLAGVVASYNDGDPESYLVGLACASAAEAEQILHRWPFAAVAWIRGRGPEPAPAPAGGSTGDGRAGGQTGAGEDRRSLLFDPLYHPAFAEVLLDTIARRRHLKGQRGILTAATTQAFRRLRGPGSERLEAALSVAEQSNNSVIFGERLILKVYRRLEEGINPDLEVGRFLTEQTRFANIAPVAGSLEYQRGHAEPVTVAILQGYVPNQGDAWTHALATLGEYFRTLELRREGPPPELPRSLLEASTAGPPPQAAGTIGGYLELARLLGRRTAELHGALASDPTEPAFAPERITPQDQRSLYQSMHALATQALQLLRDSQRRLPEEARQEARQVLDSEPRINSVLKSFLVQRPTASRIRVHGDYHLGQVLWTGSDFMIVDFEGEPARPLHERRFKRSAFRDVAGMLRSFQYASHAALHAQGPPSEAVAERPAWARFWAGCVSASFLRGYLDTAGPASFVPASPQEREVLLNALLLEKALYELRYELNSRPDWVRIPLRGILDLVAG